MIEKAVAIQAGAGLWTAVTPVIIEPVAVQDASSRQNEPRLTLFAADPEREGVRLRASGGDEAPLEALAPGEVYPQHRRRRRVLRPAPVIALPCSPASRRSSSAERVDYDGVGTDGPALLLPLGEAQAFLARKGVVKHVLISNRGDEISGAAHTDEVVRLLSPTLGPLGLEADPAKQDALEGADAAATASCRSSRRSARSRSRRAYC